MSQTASIQEFYAARIQPALDQLETERQAVVRRGVIAGLCVAAVAIALIGLVLVLVPGFWMATIFIGVGAFLGWWWAVSGPMSRFRSSFKDRVMRQIVAFIGEDLHYEPDSYLGEGEFRATRIFGRTPDRYSGEDMVSGMRGATRLRFSEVHAEYKTESTDSKGNRETHWHTIFKGILFAADFNKHFQGLTVVEPDNAERMLGFVGKALQGWGSKLDSRGELVSLDDPEFEQAFKVTATDQVEARYILSNSLMRRILELKNKTGKQIALSFCDSHVYLAIPSDKNMFEAPSMFSPITRSLSVETVQGYFADMLLVLGIVEELDLNTRIWSKDAQVPA
jgi:hypothetical protein